MILVLPLMNRVSMISHIAAGLMLVLFLYVLYIAVRYGVECADASHEEARHVLAEPDRHIDEEWRTLARRLYNEVSLQLLLMRNVLKQPESLVAGNGRAAELLGNASGMLNDAYAEMRDITRNMRIEMIDSIGFIAALESLVVHYTNIPEKPAITLERDSPKWSVMLEVSAISAYKTIRGAIFNAIRHSKAAQVRVSTHHNKTLDTCKVEIISNGVGMKVTARSGEHTGIGLIDTREWVRVLGGALKIQAADPASQERPGTKPSFSFLGQLS